jgi:hypothetical protein
MVMINRHTAFIVGVPLRSSKAVPDEATSTQATRHPIRHQIMMGLSIPKDVFILIPIPTLKSTQNLTNLRTKIYRRNGVAVFGTAKRVRRRTLSASSSLLKHMSEELNV